MIGIVHSLLHYDLLHLGGGNSANIVADLPDNVRVASNDAGLTGGIRLWNEDVWEVARGRGAARAMVRRRPTSPTAGAAAPPYEPDLARDLGCGRDPGDRAQGPDLDGFAAAVERMILRALVDRR